MPEHRGVARPEGRPLGGDSLRRVADAGGLREAGPEAVSSGDCAPATSVTLREAAADRTPAAFGPGRRAGGPARSPEDLCRAFDDNAQFLQRVGTTLCHKWTLVRLIGIGGMAAVYAAVHTIGRRDAIKVLRPEAARNRDLAARFEREARVVNRLRHPGAVEIRDMDVTEDGLPFLVMELLEGEVLTERLASPEPLPVDEALRLIDQLLDVLDAAHTLGIVHRDIKPDNLIVLPGGRLKVIDFGVAQLRGDVVGRATPWGMRLGTVGYMAPEQARGEPVDARADLFGVGATLLRMVAGPPIGPPVTRAQQLVDLVTGTTPRAAELPPRLGRDLTLVLDCALARAVDARYPDAATMRDDVHALMRDEPPPFARASVGAHGRPTRSPGGGALDAPRSEANAARRTLRIAPVSGDAPRDGAAASERAPAPSGPPAATPAPRDTAPASPCTVSGDPIVRSGRLRSGHAMRGATVIVALAVAAEVAALVGMHARRAPHSLSAGTATAAPVEVAAAAAGPSEPPPPVVAPASTAVGEALVDTQAREVDPETNRPPGTLPRDIGYLQVDGPAELGVYVNGRPLGAAGTRLRAPCGPRFVRLGGPTRAGGVPWAGPGRPVHVSCRGTTTVAGMFEGPATQSALGGEAAPPRE